MTDGLLLVGASGLAREVLAAGITGVVGILDDKPGLLGDRIGGVEVVGTIDDAASRDEQLLVCVGPSAGRRAVVRRLAGLGVTDDRFATYVARSARIVSNSPRASLDGAKTEPPKASASAPARRYSDAFAAFTPPQARRGTVLKGPRNSLM